jgi:hypothetical protein
MKTFYSIVFILFITYSVESQWEPEVRFTFTIGSYLTYSNARCIASNVTTLHLVFVDERDGNKEIYYKRSSDNGSSWSEGLRITNNSADSDFPSIAVSGSIIYIVWCDTRNGNYEIYFIRSSDDGLNWGQETRLTNNTGSSESPVIMTSGSAVHVAWADNRNGNYEIYYKRSTDGGINWGNDTRLTNDILNSIGASLGVSGSDVHIAWTDNRDDWNYEVYYKHSPDGGTNWGLDTRLTSSTGDSYFPSVSVENSFVHVVWYDNRDGNYEIYYKHSTDAGLNWGADTRLTNSSGESYLPSVNVSGPNVHVVWYDDCDGNFEIYYKHSQDWGSNWGTDNRLTYNIARSDHPFITSLGQAIHVVWEDDRNMNTSIYYRRNLTGNTIGLKNENSEIPVEFMLYQNYPNPFNPVTTINYDLPVAGVVRLVVYDILGKEIHTLINEKQTAGKYKVTWDAGTYPSGVYFYKITTGDYSETKKMILIK